MKWQGRRQSSNVEDRRGQRPVGGGFGGGGMKLGGGSLLILLLVFLLSGGDLNSVLDMMGGSQTQQTQNVEYQATEQEEELKAFSSTVFADLEDVWTEMFKGTNVDYTLPKLVIYSGSVNSGCGAASSQVGPFYCSADKSVYIDLSFYNQLKSKFKAPGDFAFAYVLAHEVGHHVQNELGVLQQVHEYRQKLSQKQYNELSVRMELQADYYAGVFAKHIKGKGYLEEGDIEEAIRAAGAVGDDTIQESMAGRANPDTFTHGTSEQRMRWFMKGYEKGTVQDGDTFNANEL